MNGNRRHDSRHGGNSSRPIKPRFDTELAELLLRLKWWDLAPQTLAAFLPDLSSPDLARVRKKIRQMLAERKRQ